MNTVPIVMQVPIVMYQLWTVQLCTNCGQDSTNCDATMNTDHRAAIGLNDKSPIQRICEMLE